MATVLEGVVVNSVDEDGRFSRLCSNPVKVEVIWASSETSLKLFDGEQMKTVQCAILNYGTFVPTYFVSQERKFHRYNFRSLELSLPRTFVPGSESDVELSLSGTFVPGNFRSHSQRNVVSLPNTNYDYLIDKLTEIKAL